MQESTQLKIKSYDYWDVFLHKYQSPYIGRVYAAAKRKNAEQVLDMTSEEREELFNIIIPAWYKVVKKLYRADWINIASLGNDWRHLHWHLIPRYFSPKEIEGLTFIDPNPKGNYAPYEKKVLPLKILLKIKKDIQREIEKF